MPKFKIGRSVSWVANSDDVEVLEFDTLEEAEEHARDAALEQLEYWAEQIDEEPKEDDDQ